MVAAQLKPLDSEGIGWCARAHALRMVHRARASHIGSALSMIDIVAVLYADVLRVRASQPEWPDRDRLIVSKGHAAVGLYAVLAEVGFIDPKELLEYGQEGSRLLGHVSHHVPGVELSTGSLGHGLPVACGTALGLQGSDARTFCILSDGELNEGSNWEAILFAGHHRLDRLTAIVDYNGIQSFGAVAEVLDLAPLDKKFESFGWEVRLVHGHDHDALRGQLSRTGDGRPVVVIAGTTKGKGVEFMENELAWHYRSPSDAELQEALAQL